LSVLCFTMYVKLLYYKRYYPYAIVSITNRNSYNTRHVQLCSQYTNVWHWWIMKLCDQRINTNTFKELKRWFLHKTLHTMFEVCIKYVKRETLFRLYSENSETLILLIIHATVFSCFSPLYISTSLFISRCFQLIRHRVECSA